MMSTDDVLAAASPVLGAPSQTAAAAAAAVPSTASSTAIDGPSNDESSSDAASVSLPRPPPPPHSQPRNPPHSPSHSQPQPPPPTSHTSSPPTHQEEEEDDDDNDEEGRPNTARICGRSTTSCGYCRGTRAWVLSVSNPTPEEADRSDRSAAEGSSRNGALDDTNGTNGVPTGNGRAAKASTAYGLLFSRLRPSTYQTLLDRGWRRSGNHLYRPDNWTSCCPALSIRLDVRRYEQREGEGLGSRGQRRVRRRLRRYLYLGGGVGDGGDGGVGGGDTVNANACRGDTKSDRGGGKKKQIRKKSKRQRGKNENIHAVPPSLLKTIESTTILATLQQHTVQAVTSYRDGAALSVIGKNGKKMENGNDGMGGKVGEKVKEEAKDSGETGGTTALLERLCAYKVMNWPVPREVRASLLAQDAQMEDALIGASNANNANNGVDGMDDGEPKTNGGDNAQKAMLRVVTASSSVGAALAGRSRGTIDRAAVAESVAQSLRRSFGVDGVQGTNAEGSGGRVGPVQIAAIEAHPGGRVNVYLRVVSDEGGPAEEDGNADPNVIKGGAAVSEGPTQMEVDEEPPLASTAAAATAPISSTLLAATTPSRRDVVGEFLRKSSLEISESYRQQQTRQQTGSSTIDGSAGSTTSSPSSSSSSQRGPYKLTVRSVPAHISASQPEVHRLFAKYQTVVHGDTDPFAPVDDMEEREKVACSGEKAMNGAGPVELVAANGTDAGTREAYTNGTTHRPMEEESDEDTDGENGLDDPLSDEDDDDDESTWRQDMYDVDAIYAHMNARSRLRIKNGYVNFHRFLCETPLAPVHPLGENDERFIVDEEGYDTHITFGTYHQQYRINGALVAVGVVDILPYCLSSVYAFYDPDLSNHLELGKYTALREIEWVQRASRHRKELVYYYLGYYIRSCTKMVYKAEYKPSELLCPTSGRWVDFEVAKKRLDTYSPSRHCCALYVDEQNESRKNSITYTKPQKKPLVASILLDIGGGGGQGSPPVTVKMLNRDGRKIVDPLIEEFIDEVGFDVARKCVVKLS